MSVLATPIPLDSTNDRLHRKQLAAAVNQASAHNSKISVQVDKNSADITTEQTVRAGADFALAQTITTLTATVNLNNTTTNAAITNEQTVRANADSALASSITTLTATVNNKVDNSTYTAGISTEQTARANGDSALASSITSLTATVNNKVDNSTYAAGISTEQTARANGDSANATAITNLTATVTSNHSTLSAAVTTEATARANADGSIMADYGISVQTLANGHKAYSGIKLIAGPGQASEVNVIASQFNVYEDLAGVTTGAQVFSVDSTGVHITGALYAGTITTNQLIAGSILLDGVLLKPGDLKASNIGSGEVTQFGIANITSSTVSNGSDQILASVSITAPASGPCRATANLFYVFNGTGSGTVKIRLNGSAIATYALSGILGAGGLIAFGGTGTLSSGSNTINLVLNATSGDLSIIATGFLDVAQGLR